MNPHNFLRKCLYKFDSQNWWFSILKSESYWMRTLQPLTPLGLSAERAASHFIYYIHVSLILDWTVFGRCSLDKMLILHYFFIQHLSSQCLHHFVIQLSGNANRSIGFCIIWMQWLKCIVLILYIFYLSINLIYIIIAFVCYIINFILVCCCCCLLIFFIHFVVVILIPLFYFIASY